MALTLGALLEASLLVVNAICVLHEKRFLAKGKYVFKFLKVVLLNDFFFCKFCFTLNDKFINLDFDE